MPSTVETLESGAQLERSFNPADRYEYDWGECSYDKGYAQVDTAQDASYYGTWANPWELRIVAYVEGDVHRTFCTDEKQFIAEMRRMHEWHVNAGYWKGIDPGFDDRMKARFTELGLADLLH